MAGRAGRRRLEMDIPVVPFFTPGQGEWIVVMLLPHGLEGVVIAYDCVPERCIQQR